MTKEGKWTPETHVSGPTIERIADIEARIGESFISEPVLISPKKVEDFLVLIGDVNPHFTPEGVLQSVLSEMVDGKMIVPGYLTLSLCSSRETLYAALDIKEPHEIISLALKDTKFLAPVPVDTKVIYEYKMGSARQIQIQSRPAVKVEWEIVAYVAD